MLYPMPSPQMPPQAVRSELRRLYDHRSAIDRLIQAIEVYQQSSSARGAKPPAQARLFRAHLEAVSLLG